MHGNPRQAVKIDGVRSTLLVENMSGLSESDTRRLARKAIYQMARCRSRMSRR